MYWRGEDVVARMEGRRSCLGVCLALPGLPPRPAQLWDHLRSVNNEHEGAVDCGAAQCTETDQPGLFRFYPGFYPGVLSVALPTFCCPGPRGLLTVYGVSVRSSIYSCVCVLDLQLVP